VENRLHDIKTPLLGRFSLVDCMPLLAAFLLACSWLATNHFLPWVSWHSEALVFAAVLISAWVVVFRLLSQRKEALGIKMPILIWPFAMLVVLAMAQGIMGVITFWGDVVVICSYAALCIACLTLGYATHADASPTESSLASPVILLALVFVIAGLASAVVALAQTFELWEHSSWIVRMPSLQRPGANLAQPNHLATLLVMAIASVVFFHELKKISNLPCALLLLVLITGLALTQSRAGTLGFLALLVWWLIKRPKICSTTSPWAAAILGAGFLMLFWVWPKFYALVQVSGTAESRVLEAGSRLKIWPQLIEALLEKPWLGWGIRQVAKAHNSVVHKYGFSEPFTYSHNFMLDLALWVGLPFSIITIITGVFWFWRRTKLANQLLPWYCLAVTIPLLVHSMFEFPFAYAYFLAPAMFLLGVLEARLCATALIRIGIKSAVGGLLIVSAGLAWITVEYINLEKDFRTARFEALHIGRTPVDYQKKRVFVLTQLEALVNATRIEPQPGMHPDTLMLFRNVALHYPWSATQYRYALALALNENPVEASRQFQVMRVQHGEKLYQKIKMQLGVLAEDRYPELRGLNLP
jgi:O-antigen ligase